MRDIYKTVKKMQTTPVRDRVKAMVAQPRGVPQARKIARQTTGYARGGVQKAFLGKLMTKLGLGKRGVVSSTRQDPLDATGQSYTRMRPEATPEKATDYFKKRMGYQKGGVMEKRKTYELVGINKDKERTKTLTKAQIDRLLKQANRPDKQKQAQPYLEAGRAKGKEHKEKLRKLLRKGEGYVKGWIGKKKGGKVDKKWIQKAVNPKHKGYCTPMTKPTCTPARKKLAQLFKRKARTGWKKAQGGLIHGKPKLATRGW